MTLRPSKPVVRFCYSFRNVSPDDIRRAVLEREDVAKYLRDDPQASAPDARERIEGYLDELRTTQRYRFYRALQHPLYPILRKVRRDRRARRASPRRRSAAGGSSTSRITRAISTIWSSRWCSTTTASGRRCWPPASTCSAARSACCTSTSPAPCPIRRNSKDPLYLVTLRAYVAELLEAARPALLRRRRPQLQRRVEDAEDRTAAGGAAGGSPRAVDRADGGGLRPRARGSDPVARGQPEAEAAVRARKSAEMVRHAVGYESRAFVTFGAPIPLARFDPDSRRDLVTLAHRVHDDIGRCHKVLPTALVASVDAAAHAAHRARRRGSTSASRRSRRPARISRSRPAGRPPTKA